MLAWLSTQNAGEDLVIEGVVEPLAKGVLVGELVPNVPGVRPRRLGSVFTVGLGIRGPGAVYGVALRVVVVVVVLMVGQ